MTMQPLLATAAVLAVLTGVAHSLLGERLIFRHVRASTWVPALPAAPLQPRHIRILWATWHLASVLAWALAGLLWRLAQSPAATLSSEVILAFTAGGFLAGSLLVLVATRGRHPGWIALLATAILSWP
jgi:hypothetical protein